MLVRLIEGDLDDNGIIDDLEMPLIPRVGEYVSVRMSHDLIRYEVIWVDYVVDVLTRNQSIDSKFVGPRVGLRAAR